MTATRFKGRLYLDIDGVVNGRHAVVDWRGTRRAAIDGVEITWAPDVIQRLDAVRESGIELVWCTTWLWYPDALNALPDVVNGLHGGRRLDVPPMLFASWGWKLRALRTDTFADPLPFCWAEDVEITTWGKHAQLAARDAGLPSPLLVQPDEVGMRGLEPRHLDQIERWAGALD